MTNWHRENLMNKILTKLVSTTLALGIVGSRSLLLSWPLSSKLPGQIKFVVT